jgi:hypothetical protein
MFWVKRVINGIIMGAGAFSKGQSPHRAEVGWAIISIDCSLLRRKSVGKHSIRLYQLWKFFN